MKMQSKALALVAAGMLTVLALPASAQQKFAVDGQGGIAMPAGRLADVTDLGPNFGLQVSYRLRPALAINLFGDLDLLSGDELAAGVTAPDFRLWHYGLGLHADMLPRRMQKWSLGGSLGIGATTFASDEFGPTAARDTYKHTYFTTSGGLRLGYSVTPNVTTFVGGKAYFMITDEKDTEALAALDPDRIKTFGSAWTFPVTAGLNVRL